MMKSESIAAIAPAIIAAQQAIGAAKKDTPNPFFKSKYADLAAVIEAVKEPLNSNGIAFLQAVTSNDAGVCVETVLLHSSGEWISETLSVPVSKHDAQGVGSAISYGKRYGLQSLVGVPSEDDDGNAATKSKPKPESSKSIGQADADSLDTDRAIFVRSAADSVTDIYNKSGVVRALDFWEMAKTKLEVEEVTAAWSFINSKIRGELKKTGESRREIQRLKEEKNATV